MRDPRTVYSSYSAGRLLQSNDLSVSLGPLSYADPLVYDMSAGYQSWGPHKDGGQWSSQVGKAPQDPSKPPATREPRPPEGEKTTKKVKKKNYQRYAKPPYSYLAMIALVIQNSPDRMLKLSQILKNIELQFPFFKEDYMGWKDSVRHNLSSNDCFRKVLKDPGKPQAKGNFWTVDVGRIPLDAMKLQNTVMARGGSQMFVPDLSPYILHNYKYDPNGDLYPQMPLGNYPGCMGDDPPLPSAGKLNSSFMIESLLHDLQESELPEASRAAENPDLPPSLWAPRPHPSSIYSSSLSTMSPVSADENPERWREVPGTPPPRAMKRQREDDESSCSDLSADRCSPFEPPSKAAFIPSELPTSYTKCVAPNVVAPPSALPFFPFPRYPYCNYGPSPYMTPPYWGLLSQPTNPGAEKPCPPPPLDLDSMLKAVPPNKSVLDVLSSHPGDLVHPSFLSQYLPSPSSPCSGQSLL